MLASAKLSVLFPIIVKAKTNWAAIPPCPLLSSICCQKEESSESYHEWFVAHRSSSPLHVVAVSAGSTIAKKYGRVQAIPAHPSRRPPLCRHLPIISPSATKRLRLRSAKLRRMTWFHASASGNLAESSFKARAGKACYLRFKAQIIGGEHNGYVSHVHGKLGQM